MADSSSSPSFASATAVAPIDSHTYSATFHDAWCIGSVPHGGYVTSTFLSVAAAHFGSTLAAQNQPHTITLHLDFLRRTSVGPVLFTVRDVKLGRQTSVIHVSLSQGTREEVVGYITNSNLHTEKGVSLRTGWKLDPPAPAADLALLRKDLDPNWGQERIGFPAYRKAGKRVHLYYPRIGQPSRSVNEQWMAWNDGARFSNQNLGFVADMWPQIVESYLRKMPVREHPEPAEEEGEGESTQDIGDQLFWYPTLVLNLDIKKVLPEKGVEFLYVRVRAKRIRNGRMDIEVVVLDEEGDVVALSNHVSFVVDAQRNVAERRESSRL